MTDNSLLPAPTWRPARSVVGTEIPGYRSAVCRDGRPKTAVKVHAVRSGRTLCGFPVHVVEWADGEDGDLCAKCCTVPAGHATHYDVLDLAGITYRQLDWWSRKGWLKPDNPNPGSGRLRTFPPGELEVVQTMGRLAAAGVLAASAAKAARNGGWLADGVRVVVTCDDVPVSRAPSGDTREGLNVERLHLRHDGRFHLLDQPLPNRRHRAACDPVWADRDPCGGD